MTPRIFTDIECISEILADFRHVQVLLAVDVTLDLRSFLQNYTKETQCELKFAIVRERVNETTLPLFKFMQFT